MGAQYEKLRAWDDKVNTICKRTKWPTIKVCRSENRLCIKASNENMFPVLSSLFSFFPPSSASSFEIEMMLVEHI